MCFVSKKVIEKALKSSQRQLKEEYWASEEKLKFYDFSAQKENFKKEYKNFKFLERVMKYQNTKHYLKQINRSR